MSHERRRFICDETFRGRGEGGGGGGERAHNVTAIIRSISRATATAKRGRSRQRRCASDERSLLSRRRIKTEFTSSPLSRPEFPFAGQCRVVCQRAKFDPAQLRALAPSSNLVRCIPGLLHSERPLSRDDSPIVRQIFLSSLSHLLLQTTSFHAITNRRLCRFWGDTSEDEMHGNALYVVPRIRRRLADDRRKRRTK